jgi:hypothetical protein
VKLKTTIVGGMLLGVLTGIGVTQHQTAWLGSTLRSAAMRPKESADALQPTPGVIVPSAQKTAIPPYETNTGRISPNAESVPDQATLPDMGSLGDGSIQKPDAIR